MSFLMASSTLNFGSSPFHSILGLFCRNRDGQLLSAEGRESRAIFQHWSAVWEQITASKTTYRALPSGRLVEMSCIELPSNLFDQSSHHNATRLRVREIYRDDTNCYIGILGHQAQENCDEELREWIDILFITKTTMQPQLPQDQHDPPRPIGKSAARRIWEYIKTLFTPKPKVQISPKQESKLSARQGYECIAEKITVLFEDMLRNRAMADEWELSGRSYFFHRILDFVNRNEQCQMALPAFPCKSPNDAKVGGSKPDMAERVALETLCAFVKGVRKIYSPGARVWVIHDGHLLSSCIGVDDDVVSEYESSLQDLYKSMFDSVADRKSLKFCSLSDLFFSEPDNTRIFNESWVFSPDLLYHPLKTKVSKTAELARKLVMASCGIDRSHLRKLILAQDPKILKSYRGLSHFMLKDLTWPSPTTPSTSQRKKIASRVAAEMMARNQAYSNLLELLFPNYIRLSIHAHNNRGPKFGIRLFPRNRVRAIDDVDGRHEPVPLYDFQIPTPWHNSMIIVEGDDMAYLAKAYVAHQALASGRYTGGWVEDGDGGGHFLLRKVKLELPPTTDGDARSGFKIE